VFIMLVNNIKYQIILLLILSIAYSCKLDKKSNEDSNKVIKKTTIVKNVIKPEYIDSLIVNEHPYVKKEFNLNDYSSEGGIVQSYSNERGYLVKIKATYFGHSGKSEWDYYFQNDSLFFVDKKEYRYKKSLSNNAEAVIDSIIESKYFLERGSLKKWVDENKFIVDSTSEKFKQESNYLIQDVIEFRRKIEATSLPHSMDKSK